MNHPLAQIVALTCYGNALLSGQKAEPFFPGNSTCVFCERVSFVTVEQRFFRIARQKEVAQTPDEWFAYLKSLDAQGIRLSCAPRNDLNFSDRLSAGHVGGGGTWTMEVLLPQNRSEYWCSQWQVWNQNAPQNRIWRVTYSRVARRTTSRPEPRALPDVAQRLTDSLEAILAFSERQRLAAFSKCFSDALDTLASQGQRLYGYHKDLAPDGFLSAETLAILHACQSAWVFGGMGSWNDLAFAGDDQKEYERVSDDLFKAVNAAIAAAASSSGRRRE